MIGIQQRLVQKQIQSPQQVLLSSLLQLPLLKFEQQIKLELEANPLLETLEEMEMEQEESQEEDRESSTLDDDEDEEEVDGEDGGDAVEDLDKGEEALDESDWENIIGDDAYPDTRAPRDDSAEIFERPEIVRDSLYDHLLSQLHMTQLSEKDTEIGDYIIWNIDEVGYLSCDVEVIAHNLDVSVEDVERVLAIIQRFEPVGIAARNLRECLLIQLEEQDPQDELALEVVRDHFEDFTNKRYEKLTKKLDIDLEDLRDVVTEIMKLNPKPGEGYTSFADNVIIPDLAVDRDDDGELRIILNDWNIPHLRINNSYKQLLMDKKKTNKETKDFVRKRLESARWLINSIHQRRLTILKVMETIIDKQREFFDKGKEFIKPMILKNVADEIHMDISTVSRVTNGKYVQTEWGVFELKYFFSEGISTDEGEDVSNRRIKQLIKDIIDKEDHAKPMNDQKIADLLKGKGYNLARRTVAKYREQMGIPVSRLRRGI
ncbi:MAG: RNA polymerase factor sigma-54 [Deferribacteres bacterium]|nr:RNA polymerase factor sigma-54 [candidate division KSB1 bacterium]MCB9511331.1 RNA polymerase factor sigma-54 [Deferribacteres bacterium]